jgi:DnaJ-class molecular chaperone
MTHYELLGIPDNATADEIKRAYRKLASQHHPDKGGDKNKFQEVQAAYDTLSDVNRRQQYDMQRNVMGGGPGGVRFHFNDAGGQNIDEIFRQFGFGGGFSNPFGQAHPQHQRRNKDLRIEIPLPLVTTLEEQVKTIQVKTTDGETATLEVKIPRGVTSGTNIKYPGLGDNLFKTLPRGDLYIQFNIHPAENFYINNVDLHTQLRVNCLLAITGGKSTVLGLDDKQFEITLPTGTQPGMKFRLAGQGLYQLNTTMRGDLYVEIVVTVPQDLPKDQLETIQSLINK